MTGNHWLTANIVEQLHKVHLQDRPLEPHVANLTDATLAGLIEYGCLRRVIPGLPDLPQSIRTSQLGQRLSDVVSTIGLRASGHSIPTSIGHQPRDIEFAVVPDIPHLLGDPIQMLFMRVTQAAQRAGFDRHTADQFQGAFSEMLSNAIEHSDSPISTLIGYHIRPNIASFVVADAGRGVFESLRENPAHHDVADHCQAINKALKDGVSRHHQPRGNGFRPIFKALLNHWGMLRFRSRKGCLMMSGAHLDTDKGVNHFPPELPGFQVAVTCMATPHVAAFPVI